MSRQFSRAKAAGSRGDARENTTDPTERSLQEGSKPAKGREGSSSSSSESQPPSVQTAVEHPDQFHNFYGRPHWRRYASCVLVTTALSILICLVPLISIRLYIGCQQPTCQNWIKEMSNSIDDSKKPCDNFYEYVCGKYASASNTWFPNAFLRLQVRIFLSFYKKIMLEDAEAMREEQGEDSVSYKAVFMTQRCLFEAFNDFDDLEQLKGFLSAYNLSWPPSSDRQPESLFNTLVELSLKRDVNLLFQLKPDENFNRKGFYMLHWDLSLEGALPWVFLRSLLVKTGELEKAFERAAFLMTGKATHPQLIQRVVDLDSRFLTVTIAPLLALRTETTLDYVKISEMHSIAGSAFRPEYLLEAMNRLLPEDRKLRAEDQMIIKNKFFLPWVADLVLGEQSRSETVSGYVAFLLSHHLSMAMSARFLTTVMPGESAFMAKVNRMIFCVVVPNQVLSYAMAGLFVDWFLDEKKLAAIRAMSAALWKGTEDVIKDVSWMDEDSRARGLKHIQRLGRVVGHPFNLSRHEEMREHYAFVPTLPHRFSAMFTAVHDAQAERGLALIGSTVPTVRGADPEQPMILVNAFYLPIYHWVFIMDGIMFAPFFELSASDAINYGALGHVVGHEVTHGFDPVLGTFNASGQRDDWWRPASRALFDERIQCLRALYNNMPEYRGQRFGDTALSENFADCGGMAKTLRAFRSLGPQPNASLGEHRYTAEQAFYVSTCFKWCSQRLRQKAPEVGEEYEDMVRLYSPLRMRCNVPLMNTPAFAQAFHCPPGAAMNPKERCDLF
ncbi:neprilysin-1-like [Haemaphysalis longicornis]